MSKKSASLGSMTADALMELRDDVARTLSQKGEDLRRQLAALGGKPSKGRKRGSKPNVLKGPKVAAKYRGPDGELWSGRGRRPLWVAKALKGGSNLEDFAIGSKSTAKKPKKASRKRRSP